MNKLKNFQKEDCKLSADENRLHKDLDIVSKYMGRLIFKLPNLKNKGADFASTAGILAEGILDKLNQFEKVLTTFVQEIENDRTSKKKCHLHPPSRWNEDKRVGLQV